jgi:DNA processing protein
MTEKGWVRSTLFSFRNEEGDPLTEKDKGWLRLHLTRGLGRGGIIRLLECFGSLEAVLAAPAAEWTARAGIRAAVAAALPPAAAPEVAAAAGALERAGARIIPLWDEARYPPLLRAIHDPPALLYLLGDLPAAETLAVVGARQASANGRHLTATICAEMAERGITVVSGLARGIDTAAHQGVLDGGGRTVGVLGCGIDRVYPPENARLFVRILEQGGILSEYPPGTPPLAGHFPGRNRIISGLARGVLIVEAAEGSGSLITADFALEQGREVFAVPGPVYAPTSGGVNRLLKEGAHLVTEARDILDILWPQLPPQAVTRRQDLFAESLPETPRALYNQLGAEPLHVDELARRCGLTPMEVSAILLHLELQGGVEQLPGMRYVRSRRP